MNRLAGLLVVAVVAGLSVTVHAEEQVSRSHQLAGTIGKLPVRIDLSRDGDKLTGTYFYVPSKTTLRTVVDVLFLDGTVDGEGRFELKENSTDVANNEVATGVLKGTLVARDEGYAVTGTWSKPDGSKPLPIAAAELRSTPGGIHVVDTAYVERSPAFRKIVTAHYPQFRGPGSGIARLNTAVKASVERTVADYKSSVDDLRSDDPESADRFALDVDYAVTLATDSVISIELNIYNDFGGAHPSAFSEALTFDLRSGAKIKLDALFRQGSRPLNVLSAKASPLFKDDFEGLADTSPSAENYTVWYLTPRGLTVVFSIPHVAGDTAEVDFPFSELKTILNPAGPVASFAK